MKYWYKSSLAKAVLIILANIMAAMMAISAVRVISYPVFREGLVDGSRVKSYENTRSFEDKFRNQSFRIMAGLYETDYYETNGKYDPNKIVDIEEFDKNLTINGKNNSGLSYRLGDIIDWYEKNEKIVEEGAEDTAKETDNPIVVCQKADKTYQYYRFKDFAQKIKTGEWSFVLNNVDFNWETTEGETELLRRLRDGNAYDSEYSMGDDFQTDFKGVQDKEGKILYTNCWGYDGYQEPEPSGEHAPIGYDSLMNLANTDPKWNGRLSEASAMVGNAVNRLGSGYESYKNINSGIEEGNSNYSYIYADLSKKRIFTNKSEYTDFAKLEKNIEKMKSSGKYVVVKPKLQGFETNVKNTEAKLWRDMLGNFDSSGEKESVFVASIDTAYPIQDDYYTEYQMFQKYGADAGGVLIPGIVAGIVFLVCVVWLTVIAGRRAEDAELHLNSFDRWKTELAAVFSGGIWGLGIMAVFGLGLLSNGFDVGDYSGDYVANSIPYIVAGVAIAVFTCSMFLIGYLSLVRRIKAGTLWKNSLLRMIFRFAKKVFENLPGLWKVILVFGVFVAAHWFVIMAASNYWLPFELYMSFWVVFEGAVFVLLVLQTLGKNKIKEGIKRIAGGDLNHKIASDKLVGDQKEIADAINCIGDGLDAAVEKSIKSERLKTDLITNVSHDIKTPLTSIINYVDLLKQENFEDPKIQRYIEVLEQKAQRLKTLTEDVVEASKVSSGNITLECMNINLVEMIQQTSGEFEEKFAARDLKEVLTLPEEEALIYVDGRRTWRILENIYNNAAKYAMPGSRIYGDLKIMPGAVVFSLKNVSEQPLNISADELTERFIRGDISRSTEGSGLGLSIAKTLTEMQKGTFELYLDGDLFKVTIAFPRVK